MTEAQLNPTEQMVVEAWTDILGRRPALGDDFFDLGGQSLGLVQFQQRVWAAYEVELELTELFGADFTVTACADAIDRAVAAVGTRS